MRWLLKRALLLWLALIALCAAGVGIGKLDRTPDALQTLGFDVCDGEPCFRGIKPGMSWAEARRRVPGAIVEGNLVTLPINTVNIEYVEIRLLENTNPAIRTIIVHSRTPVAIGRIVAQYGSPCRVILLIGNGNAAIFLYPKLRLHIKLTTNSNNSHQLTPTDLVNSWVTTVDYGKDEWGACDMVAGKWKGFTSVNVYGKSYRNSYNSTQP